MRWHVFFSLKGLKDLLWFIVASAIFLGIFLLEALIGLAIGAVLFYIMANWLEKKMTPTQDEINSWNETKH